MKLPQKDFPYILLEWNRENGIRKINGKQKDQKDAISDFFTKLDYTA